MPGPAARTKDRTAHPPAPNAASSRSGYCVDGDHTDHRRRSGQVVTDRVRAARCNGGTRRSPRVDASLQSSHFTRRSSPSQRATPSPTSMVRTPRADDDGTPTVSQTVSKMSDADPRSSVLAALAFLRQRPWFAYCGSRFASIRSCTRGYRPLLGVADYFRGYDRALPELAPAAMTSIGLANTALARFRIFVLVAEIVQFFGVSPMNVHCGIQGESPPRTASGVCSEQQSTHHARDGRSAATYTGTPQATFTR